MKSLKIRLIIILIFVFCSNVSIAAKVVMSKSPGGRTPANGGNGYHETWFLGSNEEVWLYHRYRGGAVVDDGLFVAIKDGGPSGGYSYYELEHPVSGAINGGPCHLPKNPDDFEVSGDYIISQGYDYTAPSSMFAVWRNGVPGLLDGAQIPIGSKFFFWISGGGQFQLETSILELLTKLLIVRTQAIPEGEYARWFEPSVINEKSFMIKKR